MTALDTRHERYRRGCSRWWLVIGVALPLLLIFSCQQHFVRYDAEKAAEIGRELASYPLPQATEMVGFDTHFGYPLNSNWCSASARMEIRTRLSITEVKRYYAHFQHIGIEGMEIPSVEVPFVTLLGREGAYNRFDIQISRLTACLLS